MTPALQPPFQNKTSVMMSLQSTALAKGHLGDVGPSSLTKAVLCRINLPLVKPTLLARYRPANLFLCCVGHSPQPWGTLGFSMSDFTHHNQESCESLGQLTLSIGSNQHKEEQGISLNFYFFCLSRAENQTICAQNTEDNQFFRVLHFIPDWI